MNQNKHDLQLLFDLSVDMLFVTSYTDILSVNPACISATGYSEDELLGMPFANLLHPDDVEPTFATVSRLEAGESVLLFETRLITASGETRWFSFSARADTSTGRVYASGRDVTNQRLDAERLQRYADLLERTQQELKEALEELTRIANTDQLTGLLNRRAFESRAAEELSRAERNGRHLGLAMFDIDLFKSINDENGHPVGDIVLREVARRFEAARRPYDIVARWGGEEFVAIFPDSSATEAMAAAERLALAVSARPIVVGRVPIDVRLSGGVVSTHGGHDGAVGTLVAAADNALGKAKQGGRDRIEAGTIDAEALLVPGR
jgi:diguanylate cyclase (GGDEF)-like protein/PAS domain S-box-containing protein